MDASKVREYLDENPNVYWMFEREALRMWRRGFKHYSARTIMEYLRHNSALEADPTRVFKVNDHLTPTLARDFLDRHPEIPRKFFEFRGARVERVEQRPAFRLEG